MSEIEETAKTTQEIAKTVNNALDKAEKAGTFIAKYIDAPLTEITGIWNDKLKYRRWENQLNLWTKANKKLQDLGLEVPRNELPLKLGLPLIEAASLEDDNQLQELWANLLVNSSTGFSLDRSYISVLEQLSSLEAEIFLKIYEDVSSSIEDNNFWYAFDPEEKFIDLNSSNISKLNFNLALSNLIRLDCIGHVIHLSGEKYHTTLFGKFLFEAVKEPTK